MGAPKQGTMFTVSDPANYRKLSEPFATPDDANRELQAFFAALAELRKTHHVRDVLVVVAGSVTYESGDEGEFSTTAHFGDSMRAESMAAYAYGMESARRQERISKAFTKSAIRRGPRGSEDD